jgi:hypothetical protein
LNCSLGKPQSLTKFLPTGLIAMVWRLRISVLIWLIVGDPCHIVSCYAYVTNFVVTLNLSVENEVFLKIYSEINISLLAIVFYCALFGERGF